MAITFSQFVRILSGFVIQVTQLKYSILVMRYDLVTLKNLQLFNTQALKMHNPEN